MRTMVLIALCLASSLLYAEKPCPYEALSRKPNLVTRTINRVKNHRKFRRIKSQLKTEDISELFFQGKFQKLVTSGSEFVVAAKAIISARDSKPEWVYGLQEVSKHYNLGYYPLIRIQKAIRKRWRKTSAWNEVSKIAFEYPWGSQNDIIPDPKAPVPEVVAKRMEWIKDRQGPIFFPLDVVRDQFKLKQELTPEQFTRLAVKLIERQPTFLNLLRVIQEQSQNYALTSTQVLRMQSAGKKRRRLGMATLVSAEALFYTLVNPWTFGTAGPGLDLMMAWTFGAVAFNTSALITLRERYKVNHKSPWGKNGIKTKDSDLDGGIKGIGFRRDSEGLQESNPLRK